jgi:hypothetical protein
VLSFQHPLSFLPHFESAVLATRCNNTDCCFAAGSFEMRRIKLSENVHILVLVQTKISLKYQVFLEIQIHVEHRLLFEVLQKK